MEADSQSDVHRAAVPPPAPGVFDELPKVLASARETLGAFLELVSLEGRRAGLALAWMVAGGLVAAVFIVTAWAGVMAALAMVVVSLGMLPLAAVMLVAAINLVAGAAVICGCFAMSRHLLFSATRRQLSGATLSRSAAP